MQGLCAAKKPQPPLIEVGCGSGRFAKALGLKVGIEPSLSFCRIARNRGVAAVRGRAEALPVKSRACRAVLLITVICFLKSPIPALKEIFRILIPGGQVVVAFIERDGKIHKKYILEKEKGRFLSHAKFYSEQEVCSFLKESGFIIRDIDSKSGFCVVLAEKF
ncbi:class I SAM-dependent methyltransferase [Methanoeremita antiquus]|uniref:class I SAM-dependent methyltransferase n=1 Tax=Methanomicrobium antiquum TaxID=487686 RepID=UPI0031016B66